jgi:hypothetical protein
MMISVEDRTRMEREHKIDGVRHITYKAIPYPLSPENRVRLQAVFDDERLRDYVEMKLREEIGIEVTRPMIYPVDR